MDRGGRAGQVVNLIHLDKERHGDIVPDQFEIGIAEQVNDILFLAGEVVVQAYHFIAFFKQPSQRCDPRNPAPPVTRIFFLYHGI